MKNIISILFLIMSVSCMNNIPETPVNISKKQETKAADSLIELIELKQVAADYIFLKIKNKTKKELVCTKYSIYETTDKEKLLFSDSCYIHIPSKETKKAVLNLKLNDNKYNHNKKYRADIFFKDSKEDNIYVLKGDFTTFSLWREKGKLFTDEKVLEFYDVLVIMDKDTIKDITDPNF
ncbi:MAG: hypothetical protein IKR41_01080 [Bacteroidales bacterium]|nr:hypothetical protein [Bacteroidales bacterium]